MYGQNAVDNSDMLKDEVKRRLEGMNAAYRVEELIRLQDALAHSPTSDQAAILSLWLRSDDQRHRFFRDDLSGQVD